MGEQTQPDGGAGAERDPWAPPDSGPSLDKGAQPVTPGQRSQPPGRSPAARQPEASQPPSVHNQATVTAFPAVDGNAPPGPPAPAGTPGYGPPVGLPHYAPPAAHTGAPGFAPPGYAAPGYGPPGAAPFHGGPPQSSIPAPPIAPAGPGGYGYPGYPAHPQGYGWSGMPMGPQNGMGTAAMVLGILSCCLFCLYGIVSLVLGVVAVILGVKGKRRADRGEATNRSQAQAGLITGIIGIVLGVATIVALIVGIAFAVHHDRQNGSDSTPSFNSAPGLSAPAVTPG